MRGLRVVLAAACVGGFAVAHAAGDATAPAADIDAPHAIAAPFYGDTLFDFYQDKTFAALTGLMVSQHFGRIAPHDDEAEVLRGGMLLGYGLLHEAEGVFARLIDRNASPAVRDRTWYLLARSQHLRGLDAQAERSLARIAAPLRGGLEAERRLLQAQLLMAREDYAGAAALLDALQASPDASPITAAYARFNLGVALIKRGDRKGGYAQLDAIGLTPVAGEEMRSLRDRANLARGFAALQAGEPIEAREALRRVRLNGSASDKALLGYGWAAAQLHDPQLALTPWQELAGRSGNDAAILEAKIAVPYAMSELGAYGGALQGYRQAVAGFGQERRALAESIAAIRAGKLVQGLLALNPGADGGELGHLADIRALPEMPHGAHLVTILAGNEFQQGFRNLRDLQFLGANLAQWLQTLDSFDDMLATRRRAFAERLPAVREQAGRADLKTLQQRLAALQAEFARAVATGDAAALSTAHELELQGRIGRDLGILARVGNETDLGDAGERLRRVAGALTWQRSLDMPARQWEVQKSLRTAQTALEEAQDRDAALTLAQQLEPLRNQRFATRIAALRQRLAGLQPQVAALAGEQQAALQDIAVAELEHQQQRLGVYTAQARLAVAQILDRARLARRREGEAPQ